MIFGPIVSTLISLLINLNPISAIKAVLIASMPNRQPFVDDGL